MKPAVWTVVVVFLVSAGLIGPDEGLAAKRPKGKKAHLLAKETAARVAQLDTRVATLEKEVAALKQERAAMRDLIVGDEMVQEVARQRDRATDTAAALATKQSRLAQCVGDIARINATDAGVIETARDLAADQRLSNDATAVLAAFEESLVARALAIRTRRDALEPPAPPMPRAPAGQVIAAR